MPSRTPNAMSNATRITPSILSADFARLGEEVRDVAPPAPTGSTST